LRKGPVPLDRVARLLPNGSNIIFWSTKPFIPDAKVVEGITHHLYNFENAAITFDRFHVMKLMNEAYLKKWYFWATHCRLPPVIEMARTLKAHWRGILNYINIRIDNGVLEGINSLIQSAKSSARGFRSTKNLIITIYLRLGKLNFNLPT